MVVRLPRPLQVVRAAVPMIAKTLAVIVDVVPLPAAAAAVSSAAVAAVVSLDVAADVRVVVVILVLCRSAQGVVRLANAVRTLDQLRQSVPSLRRPQTAPNIAL